MGNKVSDSTIIKWLKEILSGEESNYGYRKLTKVLNNKKKLIINHKKVYRLCAEERLLKPQREKKFKRPRVLAKREIVTGSNQLWQMDIKYGCIENSSQHFYQLSLIDVFDREVIEYHLGLSCKADDAIRIVKNALIKRGLFGSVNLPKVRTDNGPQFIANNFQDFCQKRNIIHERIPVASPNFNAHIESFHAILEDDCYSKYMFRSFMEAYKIITEYMDFYNNRRIHSRLKYLSPTEFREAIQSKTMNSTEMVA